ncbi:MAG: TetR/AcrR family transcriptional regulator [Gemmatimonadaceae bacterium]|nr:TetR/AcrR family transcriptional regulator [Gemmatimonadaceae bacterium]
MAYPSRISADSVLRAAIEIVEKYGVSALGMRPVAERLGVKAASLYKHCDSLESLRALVADYAVRHLTEQLTFGISQTRLNAGSARLAALMWSYALWAEENPGLYDTIPVGQTAANPLWMLIREEIGLATGRPNDDGAALAVWSFLHGHVLLARGPLANGSSGADAMERGMVALLRGL